MKTPVQNILDFLTALSANNNREWFAEHKDWYAQCKADFEQISDKLIAGISQFDPDIKNVQTKDCTFRIYRDTRFSHDKTPYKTHFGTYIASHGGRKSPRGGYYLHIEPDACFLAAGVWCPEPAVLKALRQAVYDNMEEFKEIVEQSDFARYFSEFEEENMLKNVPREFPKDFPGAYYLKLKHYCVSCPIDTKLLLQDDFIAAVTAIFKTALPFNRFLNYTVDEVRQIG
jgi:uncharacterized protein (TIGR02453 family)